jgi:hypothetical protein
MIDEIAPVSIVSHQAWRFRPNHSGSPHGVISESHIADHDSIVRLLRSTSSGSRWPANRKLGEVGAAHHAHQLGVGHSGECSTSIAD